MNETYGRMAELMFEAELLAEGRMRDAAKKLGRGVKKKVGKAARTAAVTAAIATGAAGQGERQGPPTKPGASKEVTQTEPGSMMGLPMTSMRKLWKPYSDPKKLQGPPTHKQHVKNMEKVIAGWKKKQDAQKAKAGRAAKREKRWTDAQREAGVHPEQLKKAAADKAAKAKAEAKAKAARAAARERR